MLQNAAVPLIDLNLADRFNASRFESQIAQPDAREQGKHGSHALPRFCFR
jgi:hypothetical protein